jgi:chorismate synthase
MLRFLTAGESHGQALVAILEGMPAGLSIDFEAITTQLRRRQTGYGRGRRMAIESDRAQALSGIRHGVSTGAPIALQIPNKDWENWQRTMHVEATMPRTRRGPIAGGHPPAAGPRRPCRLREIRPRRHAQHLERASARETAARVAVGAIARQLLQVVGVGIVSQ